MKSQICKCCKKELPLDSEHFGKRFCKLIINNNERSNS